VPLSVVLLVGDARVKLYPKGMPAEDRHFGDLGDLLRVPLFHDLPCGPSGNVLVLDSDVSPGKWAFLVLV
jgi:hypothetical protein